MTRRKIYLLGNKSVRLPSFEGFVLTKRQRFVISALILSSGLFISEHLLGKSGVLISLVLSLLSSVFFVLSVRDDLKKDKSLYVYLLPIFLYTLATGLFYFLTPFRFLSRFLQTILYAIGIYSLYLSQNIFVVASLRTIPLLSGARIVSFVITLPTYFFLSSVVFSLPIASPVLKFILTSLLVFVLSFAVTFQAIAMTYERSVKKIIIWSLAIALALCELSMVLWFWPTPFWLICLFLMGIFYTTVGLSHAWFDKRLFRGIMWEYIWWGAFVFFILILFTPWRG